MPDDEIAKAWRGFDENRRTALLQKMSPAQKANLRKSLEGGPAAAQSSAAPMGPGERFLRSMGGAVTSAAKGLYHSAEDVPRNPEEQHIEETQGHGGLFVKRTLYDPQVQQGREALADAKQGRYSEAVGHGMAAALPMVGPWAAQVGEQVGKQAGSGDYAGAAGTLAGNAALYAAPKMFGKLRELSESSRANKLAYASGSGTTELVKNTLPEVTKVAGQSTAPKTVGEYLDTIKTAKGNLNKEYANAIGPYANRPTMPTAISRRILALETPNMMQTAAGRAQAAIIRRAASEFQKPWTLGQLDAERIDANGRLNAFEKKSIADQYAASRGQTRSAAIDKAIADGVRETVYPMMDQLTGKPPGYFLGIKQQIGDMLQLQSLVDERVRSLRDTTARVQGAPPLDRAHIGLGVSSSLRPHGYIAGLKEAVFPKNVEGMANKRVAQAFKPGRNSHLDLPISAIYGEQQEEQAPEITGPMTKQLQEMRGNSVQNQ